jgi:hypothetical protein
MNMNKIEQKDLEEFWKYTQLAGSYTDKIEQRITYVLRRIYQEFDFELDYWYFDGAEEGQVGDLARHLDKDIVSGFITESKTPGYIEDFSIDFDDGTVADFGYGFPTRWLYEDFEDELVRGKASYIQKQQDKKAQAASRRAAKKAEKALLKASAASKLTLAEKKALGLS